jgi:hypothetical protein
VVSDADPSDRLADARRAIERDAHELRARAHGTRATVLAALSGIAEIRQVLGVVMPRRRPAPRREDRPASIGEDGAAPRHDC